MPNPDTTPYVDLRLFDKDAQDVFDAALVNLRTYLPDWEPREGHMEVLLLEALALEVAEGIFAINRLPGAVTEILLRLYGIARDLGAAPTADFQFTAVDTTGHFIPAGVRVTLPVADSDDPLVFTTTTPIEVPVGQLAVTVPAVADRFTDVANGTPPGTAVELLDSLATIELVELATAVTGGAGEEDDVAWFTRGVERFSRLTETLVQPGHFEAAAREDPLVSRAFALDNYDPSAGGAVGTHPGHVTVAVYGDSATVSSSTKEVLRTRFELAAQANLAVHVIDPTVTSVEVDATVTAKPGFTATQVQDNCAAALEAYLSPTQWTWGSTVYRNELIALLDGVEGVDRVVSLTTPANDLALAGVAPLADFNAAASVITVQ